ncbi:MAG: hypothetical protein AB7G87_03755 [Clostridia bacterium]
MILVGGLLLRYAVGLCILAGVVYLGFFLIEKVTGKDIITIAQEMGLIDKDS